MVSVSFRLAFAFFWWWNCGLFRRFFVKGKIWGHLLKSSPVMIRMSGICLQATRIRFPCDFARFSKNNKTGIETDDFKRQEKCQYKTQWAQDLSCQTIKLGLQHQIFDQTIFHGIHYSFTDSIAILHTNYSVTFLNSLSKKCHFSIFNKRLRGPK